MTLMVAQGDMQVTLTLPGRVMLYNTWQHIYLKNLGARALPSYCFEPNLFMSNTPRSDSDLGLANEHTNSVSGVTFDLLGERGTSKNLLLKLPLKASQGRTFKNSLKLPTEPFGVRRLYPWLRFFQRVRGSLPGQASSSRTP